MKCFPMPFLILFIFSNSLFGRQPDQTEIKKLVVNSITEYVDGYVIKGIDKLKSDTVNIISYKEEFTDGKGYEKIQINGIYNFKIFNLLKHMAPTGSTVMPLFIKTTLVWKHTDRVRDIPVYARNMKGLYIKTE